MYRFIFLLLIGLSLVGCAKQFTEVSPCDIVKINSSPTYEGHFYIGSDKTHHYFVEKWDYKINKNYKVSKKELTVYNEIPLNTDEIKLCSLNTKMSNVEEFGKAQDRTFYKFSKKTSGNQHPGRQ